MRAWRRTVIGAVLLALTAALSAAITAHATDGDVMTGESATWVTFIDQSCSVDEHPPVTDGVIQRMRGVRTTCDVRFDDPRISGTVATIGNYDCHATAGCVTWGTQELDGPDGSWRGSFTGTIDLAFTERALSVMAGTAAYEGLTLVIDAVGPLGEAPSVVGIIYEGGPPPLSEVPPAG